MPKTKKIKDMNDEKISKKKLPDYKAFDGEVADIPEDPDKTNKKSTKSGFFQLQIHPESLNNTLQKIEEIKKHPSDYESGGDYKFKTYQQILETAVDLGLDIILNEGFFLALHSGINSCAQGAIWDAEDRISALTRVTS